METKDAVIVVLLIALIVVPAAIYYYTMQPPAPPSPGEFSFTNLVISEVTVPEGESVTITADVENTGGASVTGSVTLRLNGLTDDTETITVEAGESTTVTFTVTKPAGDYSVDVAGLTGSFAVMAPKILKICYVSAHWGQEPDVMDPTSNLGQGSIMAPNFIAYENLYGYYDPQYAREGEFITVPWIAEDMPEVSEDGLVYTIKIREGIKFHSGNELTADDVVYSFRRNTHASEGGFDDWAMDLVPGILAPNPLGPYDHAEKVDDYTVKVYYRYRTLIGVPNTFVFDSQLLEENSQTSNGKSDHGHNWLLEGHDAGSGPYYIASSEDITHFESFTYTRFGDYWGGPAELSLPTPYFEKLAFIVINEMSAAKMALEVGDIDILYDVTPEVFLDYIDRDWPTATKPRGELCMLLMHVWRGPLRHWEVRKAIKMAVNYTTIVEDIMRGIGTQSQGLIAAGVEGWKTNHRYYEDADVQGAKALLDKVASDPTVPEWLREACAVKTDGPFEGYRFSVSIVIRPEPRYGVNFVNVAMVLKEDMKKIGIELVVQVYTVTEYYAKIWDPTIPEMMWLQPTGFGMEQMQFGYNIEPMIRTWFGCNDTIGGEANQIPPFCPDNLGPDENMTYHQYMSWAYTRQQYATTKEELIEMWNEAEAVFLEYGFGVSFIFVRDLVVYREGLTDVFVGTDAIGLMPSVFFWESE